MPKLSLASQSKLDTCEHDLKAVFEEVIKHVDFVVIEGHRGEEAQNKAFAEGKSKLKWPKGEHNKFPSHAVDVAPYPIDWNNKDRFIYFAGVVMGVAAMKGVKLRWGGDFNRNGNPADESFKDLVHFELEN